MCLFKYDCNNESSRYMLDNRGSLRVKVLMSLCHTCCCPVDRRREEWHLRKFCLQVFATWRCWYWNVALITVLYKRHGENSRLPCLKLTSTQRMEAVLNMMSNKMSNLSENVKVWTYQNNNMSTFKLNLNRNV